MFVRTAMSVVLIHADVEKKRRADVPGQALSKQSVHTQETPLLCEYLKSMKSDLDCIDCSQQQRI